MDRRGLLVESVIFNESATSRIMLLRVAVRFVERVATAEQKVEFNPRILRSV